MASPIYRNIAEELRRQIEAGRFKGGQQLPTELELRDRYGASRNTVRDAVKWLTNLGLVETRPGQGTFVAQSVNPVVVTLSSDRPSGAGGVEDTSCSATVSMQGRKPSTSPVQVEVQEASLAVSDVLRIRRGDQVISRHERRYIDGIPWSMQTSFYPMEFAERGAGRLISPRNIDQGTIQYLADTLHILQVGYRDWITVRAPNPIEAEFFMLHPDGRITVCEVWRSAFDQSGQPMQATVTVFPADRYQFVHEIGTVPQDNFLPSPKD